MIPKQENDEDIILLENSFHGNVFVKVGATNYWMRSMSATEFTSRKYF